MCGLKSSKNAVGNRLESCERWYGNMVPDSLMARAVDNLVRGRTGHMSEELRSHLAWVTTKQSLSVLTLGPCEDKPRSFQVKQTTQQTTWTWSNRSDTDWEAVDSCRTPGCWPTVGSFPEGHRSSLLSQSTNPVTVKRSLKARKSRLANCFLLKQKISLQKNLQLISLTSSFSIPESFLF